MRILAAVMLVCAACASSTTPGPDEPTTAAEKQRREARASGDVDPDTGKWGGWKYEGDREDCFFVVGRRCFRTQEAACNAAKCASAELCDVVGGGPAAVSCKKPPS
jgi:hypothetical protein